VFILKGVNSLISPDLLHLLASMGHGDEIVIADANFPATSVARRLVHMTGVNATSALEAILSLVPLDQYIEHPAAVMAVVDDPQATPEIYTEFLDVIVKAEDKNCVLERVERFAFYERARKAFGVIATNEIRLYGNIIISKGVISPG